MNKVIWILVALVIVVGGFFVLNNYIYQEKQADEAVSGVSERDVYLNQLSDESVEIEFDYQGGPDGYVIDDLSTALAAESEGTQAVTEYRIINAKEKAELETSEAGREGPPVISLMVFQNDNNQSASMWVDAYPAFSNINQVIGEVNRDAVVAGANAVRYTTDGLYLTDNVVVAQGGYIYHFSGSYLEADSVIHHDFKAILDSVRFTEPAGAGTGAGAKIDVRVACESALAYMQFENGEAGDQFVAECVAGEHPEVIERFIKDLGRDGAMI